MLSRFRMGVGVVLIAAALGAWAGLTVNSQANCNANCHTRTCFVICPSTCVHVLTGTCAWCGSPGVNNLCVAGINEGGPCQYGSQELPAFYCNCTALCDCSSAAIVEASYNSDTTGSSVNITASSCGIN
jgi:hypothetical protein